MSPYRSPSGRSAGGSGMAKASHAALCPFLLRFFLEPPLDVCAVTISYRSEYDFALRTAVASGGVLWSSRSSARVERGTVISVSAAPCSEYTCQQLTPSKFGVHRQHLAAAAATACAGGPKAGARERAPGNRTQPSGRTFRAVGEPRRASSRQCRVVGNWGGRAMARVSKRGGVPVCGRLKPWERRLTSGDNQQSAPCPDSPSRPSSHSPQGIHPPRSRAKLLQRPSSRADGKRGTGQGVSLHQAKKLQRRSSSSSS